MSGFEFIETYTPPFPGSNSVLTPMILFSPYKHYDGWFSIEIQGSSGAPTLLYYVAW